VHLSRFASRVHLLVRGEGLEASMSAYLIEQIGALENVELHTRTEVRELRGSEHLQSAVFSGPNGELELPISAVFVFIGQQPRTAWLDGVVARDEKGFILTGAAARAALASGWTAKRDPYPLETSIPGVFVAGDVRADSVKRVGAAVGEGATVIQHIHAYLEEN